ncbi:MAG: tRNA-dihydrouridine synthase [Candidatus Eisenbacteria bacterium]|nr:tRNA-dihydrouridine synthase [Candidatus Eisenbacteria bacterium]
MTDRRRRIPRLFRAFLTRLTVQTLVIGTLSLQGHVVMAPMAGVGGPVFRRIAREQGASLVVTPLISAEGIVRSDRKTLDMTAVGMEEQPCAVQIFGDNPAVMARAARVLESQGARLIDINAGCPSKRIVAGGAGVRLILDQERLYAVVAAVIQAVSIPVTAKTRLGWHQREILVIPVVHALTRAGVAAITIHARLKSDGPAAPAQWEWIRVAAGETDRPVIGNGGIESPLDARRMIESTGCAGVMVGRAAVGRPWLLGQCQQAISGDEPAPDPPASQRICLALRHLELQASADPSGHLLRATSGALSAYVRGFPQAKTLRLSLLNSSTYQELAHVMRDIIPDGPAEGARWKGDLP